MNDTRAHEREAAEKALAHEVGSKVSGDYRRSDLFDRRNPLMREWAAYCTEIVAPLPTHKTSSPPKRPGTACGARENGNLPKMVDQPWGAWTNWRPGDSHPTTGVIRR